MHSYSHNRPGDGTFPRNRVSKDRDSPIRMELVQRIRKEIALGLYDTPEKMEIALKRLFENSEE